MNVQKLDTHTYKELFADALKEWKQRTKQEEIYPSDVSYTLLEMQAMLVDMLNYYSEQVQESHKKKYELLQQEPLPETRCRSLPFRMQPNHPVDLQKGTPFSIALGEDYLTLEAEHAYHLVPNEICSIYVQNGYHSEQITELLRSLEGTYTLPLSEDACMLYLRLKNPLPRDAVSSFYICVENSCEQVYGLEWPKLVDMQVDYFSIHGWQNACDVQDDTHALLNSGELRFRPGKDMAETTCFEENGFWLRLRIKETCYDHPIGLQAVWMNVILLQAVSTLAKTWMLSSLEETELRIAEDIAKENYILQIQKLDGRWVQHPCRRVQTRTASHFYWEKLPSDAISARLVAQREKLKELVSTFTINGISSQRIDIAPASTYRLAFQVAQGIWQDGVVIDRYEKANGAMGCYRDETGIIMGNGRDFQLPKAMENGLFFTAFEQLSKPVTLHRETVRIYHPHMNGCNALSASLYEQAMIYGGIFFHKEKLKEFLLQYPLLSLMEVRIQSMPGKWRLYILDSCDHACHMPSYQTYVQHLVEQHLPFTDDVSVQDIKLKRTVIQLQAANSVSWQIQKQAEALCKTYMKRCQQEEVDAAADELRQELRDQCSLDCIRCCFQTDRESEVLRYEAAVSYVLADVVITHCL